MRNNDYDIAITFSIIFEAFVLVFLMVQIDLLEIRIYELESSNYHHLGESLSSASDLPGPK